MPDGSTNHLHIVQRDARANPGLPFAMNGETDITACLSETSFVASGGSPGFGGGVTGFEHFAGAAGALELTPHNQMHIAISGAPVADPSSPSGAVRRGFMASTTRAPLDPIFWLHHCNVDRLWEVWLKRDSAHTNPTRRRWRTGVRFNFHDSAGAPVTMTSSQVVNTRAAPLLYEYDDTTDPLVGP
jgi:tyrosinase